MIAEEIAHPLPYFIVTVVIFGGLVVLWGWAILAAVRQREWFVVGILVGIPAVLGFLLWTVTGFD